MDGPLLKPVLEAHFEANEPHHPKILSYNKAVTESIPNIIKSDTTLVVEVPAARIKTKTKARTFEAHDDEYHVFDLLATSSNKAFFTESDGTCHPLLPREARQRNLTIQSTQYASIQHSVYRPRVAAHIRQEQLKRDELGQQSQQQQQQSAAVAPDDVAAVAAVAASDTAAAKSKVPKNNKASSKKTKSKLIALDDNDDGDLTAPTAPTAAAAAAAAAPKGQPPEHLVLPTKVVVRAEDLRSQPDKYELVSRNTEHNIPICNFPVMTRSVLCHLVDGGSPEVHGECPFDTGGCFIIIGSEKRLMYRDCPAGNQPYCSTVKNNDSHMVEYRSEFPDYRSTSTNKLCLTKEAKMRPATLHIQGISLVTWLRALGVAVRGQEIFDLLCMHMQVDVQEPSKGTSGTSKAARLAPILDSKRQAAADVKQEQEPAKAGTSGGGGAKELKAARKRRDAFVRVFENTLLEGNRQLLKLQRELTWAGVSTSSSGERKEPPAARDLGRLPHDRGELQRLATMAIGRLSKESERSAQVLEVLGRQYVQQKLLPNMAHYWHPDTLTEAESNSLRTTTLIWHACLTTEFSKNKALKTDKDSLLDKRADNCDDLLSSLFRQLWRRYLGGVAERVKKALTKGASFSLDQVFGDDNSVGKGLCDAISTGNWHADRSKITQTGISQRVSNKNYIDNVTQATKHVNPLRKEAKQSGPRMLHPTAIRTTCPHDTPEGESCGACTFSAVLVHHTMGFDDSVLVGSLRDLCRQLQASGSKYDQRDREGRLVIKMVLAHDTETILQLATSQGRQQYRFASHILCNGRPLVHVYHLRAALSGKASGDAALELLRLVAGTARQWRRDMQIPLDTGISVDQTTHDPQSFVELSFRTDRKRKLTPCINMAYIDQLERLYGMVKKGIPLKWIDMVSSGLIEYMDKREEADVDVLIALDLAQAIGPGALLADQVSRQKYSHVEISGVIVKGLCAAATLPLAEFVAGSRLTFGAAMVRQAAGAHSTVVNTDRMDLSRCELEVCQAPMMRTVIYDIFGFGELPAGQNQDVLILSASDNQEDSQVHQRNVIDRGGSRTFSYRTTSVTGSMIDFAGDKAGVVRSRSKRARSNSVDSNDSDVDVDVDDDAGTSDAEDEEASIDNSGPSAAAAAAGGTHGVNTKTMTMIGRGRSGTKRKYGQPTAATVIAAAKAANKTANSASGGANNKEMTPAQYKKLLAEHAMPALLGQDIIRKVPVESCYRAKRADYSATDDDGIVSPGQQLTASSVLVQRSTAIAPVVIRGSNLRDHGIDIPERILSQKCSSEVLRRSPAARTHRVMVGTDGSGKVVVRVQYVEKHRPEVGDKFNARKGQKGVIGAIWSEADMYFNQYGRSAAIVLNTCAFPSRMTWSMFLEQLLCELGAINGSRVDGTSFSKNWMQALIKQLDHKLLEPLSALDRSVAETKMSFVERYAAQGYQAQNMENSQSAQVLRNMNALDADKEALDDKSKAAFAETQQRITDIIGRALQLLGRHPTGKQKMYNGRTGKALNGTFFMVPCYIMCSSQHQVHKKVRGVSAGPVDPQTRQPVAGRERDGGLRIGEMERDAMTAHGAEGCVHALLYNASDPAKITICHNCSMPSILADNGKHNFCKICNAFDTGLQCPISYTTELTRKELGAAVLNLQLHVEPI